MVIDTNNLTVNGNAGGAVQSQLGGPDIAVFAFDGGSNIFSGVQVTGNRPLALLFQGDYAFRSFIDIRGGNGFDGVVNGQDHGGSGFGVAGGHRGGRGGPFQENIALDTGRPFGDGGGPGGGTRGASDASGSGSRPGGGGAFGSDGGIPFGIAPGGTAYGDITQVLEGGSGGSGGGGHCCGGFGRGGGGHIALLTNDQGQLVDGGALINANAGQRDPIDCVAGEVTLASGADIGESSGQQQISSVSEPMSAALFLSGLAGLGLVRRRSQPA